MVWSVEDKKKLASMWVREFPAEDIATTINRPITAVKAKAKRMGLAVRNKSLKKEIPKIKRKCLKCRKEFMAEKIHFICKECKATTEWKSQGGSFL